MVTTRSSSKEALLCLKPYTRSQRSFRSSGGLVDCCLPMNQVQVQREKKVIFPKIKIGLPKNHSKGFSSKSIVYLTKPHTPILGSSLGQMKMNSLHSINVNRVSLTPSGPLSHLANYHTAQATAPGSVSSNSSESSGLPSPSPFYKSTMNKYCMMTSEQQ
jgi:hypothetical protein